MEESGSPDKIERRMEDRSPEPRNKFSICPAFWQVWSKFALMGVGTSILERAKSGDLKTVYELIDKGADIHERDEVGWTPLFWAVDQGNVELVQILIERGAEINSRTENGSTPLHCAAYRGHVDICKDLLDCKADINALLKDGGTPLHSASFAGQQETCGLLLDRGADVNAHVKDGGTPLHSAARGGQTVTSKLLIDRNADLNSRTQDGGTPLHSAAMGGQSEVSRLLVELMADINAIANNGATPLHAACYCGQPDVAKLLIDLKASVNAKAKEAWTPLHSAARGGHLLVSKLLVDGGADIGLRTEDGRLPLDCTPKNALQLRSLLRGESVIVEEVCLTNPRVFEKDGLLIEKNKPYNRHSPSKYKRYYSTSPSKQPARNKTTRIPKALPPPESSSSLPTRKPPMEPAGVVPPPFSFSSFVSPLAKLVGSEPISNPPAPLTPSKSAPRSHASQNGFHQSWPALKTPPTSAPSTPQKKAPSSYGTYTESSSPPSSRHPTRSKSSHHTAYASEFQGQSYLPTVTQPTPVARGVPEVKQEVREWNCEICGFTNGEDAQNCYLCGASSPFSSNEMGGIADAPSAPAHPIPQPSFSSVFESQPPPSLYESSVTFSPFNPTSSYTSTAPSPPTSAPPSYDVFSAFSTLPPLASSPPVITHQHLDYGSSSDHHPPPFVVTQERKVEREKPEGDSYRWQRDESRSKMESQSSVDVGKDTSSAQGTTMLCPICTHLNTLSSDHNGHCDVCGCPLSGY